MRRNLRRALPIGRPMCVAPSLYALAQWWRDPMESVNKGDTVFVWGFPWHIHSRINLFWFNSRRKHNTKFQHNLKSQRQFCWIYSVFHFSNIHVRPLVSGPENGRLFIKNENWYIIGKTKSLFEIYTFILLSDFFQGKNIFSDLVLRRSTRAPNMGDGGVFRTPCADFSRPVEELEYTCLLKRTFTETSHDRGFKTWQTPATYPACVFCGKMYRWGAAYVECHMYPNISK